MKTLWTLLITVHVLFAFEYGLKPQQVGKGIYCFFGAPEVMNEKNNGNMVNSCFADMGEGWLVIDSGPTYFYAKEAAGLMRRIKNVPVTYVVNTHVHDDHWLGNNYYLQTGATVLGSEAFVHEAHETPTRMQSRISAEAYELTVATFPQHYIREERVISTANGDIVIRSLRGKAHTYGDLYVYLPSRKALFAGDLVFNDRLPSLRDGDITGWIKALNTIKAMDLELIVGGHGYNTGKDAADFTLNYLNALKSALKQAIEKGSDIEDAVASITLPEYKSANLYEPVHRQNVNSAYRMLEWDDE